MRLYDKSTTHNHDEEDDYQYQGKRRDQVEYSDKLTGYILIEIAIILTVLAWQISLL